MKKHNLYLYSKKYSEQILNENFKYFSSQDLLDLLFCQTLSEDFYRTHWKNIPIGKFATYQNIRFFSESFIEKLLISRDIFFFKQKENIIDLLQCKNLTKDLILKYIDIFYQYPEEIQISSVLTNKEKEFIIQEIKEYNSLKEII